MGDLSRAPLGALSSETKLVISTLLNPKRFISTSDGYPRDFKGLAQVCQIGGEMMPNVLSAPDPTGLILTITESKSKDFTLQRLKEALETIGRWDIVDDTQEMLEKDAALYLERLQRSQDTAEKKNEDMESEILTIDDLFRMEAGQDTQHYDAFVLYAQEDTDFANELVHNLENENNMKLCLKERDLIAGISFEHEAIMRLIVERCNRLILVISPDFFKSPANQFFINFAQAAGIDKQQERKIIPCIYKTCELPKQLQYFTKIYYNKLSPENFWRKLVCSTKVMSNGKVPKSAEKSTKSKPKSSESESALFVKKTSVEIPEEKPICTKPKTSVLSFLSTKRKSSTSNSIEESKVSETIPSLPSLDNLSSLPSLQSIECTTEKPKKKNFVKRYAKKFLLAKS